MQQPFIHSLILNLTIIVARSWRIDEVNSCSGR